jgi:hypothetical protein
LRSLQHELLVLVASSVNEGGQQKRGRNGGLQPYLPLKCDVRWVGTNGASELGVVLPAIVRLGSVYNLRVSECEMKYAVAERES